MLGKPNLRDKEELKLDGYIFKGNNRKSLHINAPKGSGSVDVVIKELLLQNYVYAVLDKSRNGTMAIKFTHKESLYTFIIINGYLPPDRSVWEEMPLPS